MSSESAGGELAFYVSARFEGGGFLRIGGPARAGERGLDGSTEMLCAQR
jgi:hypothetical protein